MKIQNKEEQNINENQSNKELTDSLRNIKIFNDKMLLSTSLKNKEILLWSENSGTVAFSYTDENLRTFIPTGKIKVIDPNLYSEYFIYLHENKSLFNVWNTSNSQYYSKFSCTDEKISCFCISIDSNILFVGTVSGYIISYNLALGKILRNIQIVKSEILKMEQIENILIVLTTEKIIIYNFYSFLDNENNSQMPKEKACYNYNLKINSFQNENNNIDKNNINYIYKNFIIENNYYIYLWSNNSIIILNIEDLKPYKLFHVLGENEEYKKLAIIDKLLTQDGKIFFNNGIKEIFKFNSNNYNSNNTHEIKINKNNSMLYLPNTVKFSLGNISIFVLGTKNNIITGHEDGKICTWKQNNANALFYTYENMFQIHKGAITNILFLNKPISQYGLNFNKQISECVVNKVQTKKLEKVNIKNNYGISSVTNFIDENIESNMVDILLKMNQPNEENEDNYEISEDNNNEELFEEKNDSKKEEKNKIKDKKKKKNKKNKKDKKGNK